METREISLGDFRFCQNGTRLERLTEALIANTKKEEEEKEKEEEL